MGEGCIQKLWTILTLILIPQAFLVYLGATWTLPVRGPRRVKAGQLRTCARRVRGSCACQPGRRIHNVDHLLLSQDSLLGNRPTGRTPNLFISTRGPPTPPRRTTCYTNSTTPQLSDSPSIPFLGNCVEDCVPLFEWGRYHEQWWR